LRQAGHDFMIALSLELLGVKEMGNDYRVTFFSVLYSKYHLYPRESYTTNIGLDGSGENCKKNESSLFLDKDLRVDASEVVKMVATPEWQFNRSYKRRLLVFAIYNKVISQLFYYFIKFRLKFAIHR
jgi:hypothetical protein